jgi:uncharacterized protein HemY
LSEIAI